MLTLLDSIDHVCSAASLQWFVTLLLKVTNPDETANVSHKCINLLERISDELYKRTNPYHLLLRSRFGLFGTPLESELFDVEPPPPLKASSTTLTYASVVSNDGATVPQQADFHLNYAFNKETLDPKEVLSITKGDGKIRLKNIAPSKLVRGLLETEPLHFTCTAASEGTRVERADAAPAPYVNNLIPITVTAPHTISSGTKKVDMEQIVNDIVNDTAAYQNSLSKVAVNAQGNFNNSYAALVDAGYTVVFQTDNVKNEDFSKLSKWHF